MTTTTHLIDFCAAGIDWQSEVEYDGEGFSVLWVDRLDANSPFEGVMLDAIGCRDVDQTHNLHFYGEWCSLRSLALAAAESKRDAIDDNHRDQVRDSRHDHAERRAEP